MDWLEWNGPPATLWSPHRPARASAIDKPREKKKTVAFEAAGGQLFDSMPHDMMVNILESCWKQDAFAPMNAAVCKAYKNAASSAEKLLQHHDVLPPRP